MARNFYRRFLTVLIIIVVIFTLNSFFDNFLQNLVYKSIEKPGAFFTENLIEFSKYTDGFLKAKKLVDENSKLQIENNELLGQLAELESLKRENEFLRKELDVAGRLDSPLLLAQIFNIQRGALSSTALINKGAGDGVRKSSPVITAGNVLVGIVDQVFDNYSIILMADDPRVKVSGRIQNTDLLVDAVGHLQNEVKLNLVAVGDEIDEGNIVVTSGLDGLPETLLIAKIAKVEVPSGALFKSVTAKPFFNPSLGSQLFVILR